MLQESSDELVYFEGTVLDLSRAVVTVAECDATVLVPFEAAVDEGGLEDVPGKVFESALTVTGMLQVNDPVLVPDFPGGQMKQPGSPQALFELRAEVDGQGVAGHEEAGTFWWDPSVLAIPHASSGDEHVNVRVIDEGPSPGMKHGESSGTRAKIPGVFREHEEGSGRGLEEDPVGGLLMRSDEVSKLGGQGEGEEEAGAGRKTLALTVEPAVRLLTLALRAVPVPAGVI